MGKEKPGENRSAPAAKRECKLDVLDITVIELVNELLGDAVEQQNNNGF